MTHAGRRPHLHVWRRPSAGRSPTGGHATVKLWFDATHEAFAREAAEGLSSCAKSRAASRAQGVNDAALFHEDETELEIEVAYVIVSPVQ
jgi:hypothetical protein